MKKSKKSKEHLTFGKRHNNCEGYLFSRYYFKMIGDFPMKTLQSPRFHKLSLSECAGAPILRTLWDRFDFSLLLAQSGMMKRSGTPSWLICFLYVVGLVSNCSSVVQMADLAKKDTLLKAMFKPWKLAQYTMSRFFTTSFA